MSLKMYKYLLVSSITHQEKNAVSEAAWILSHLTNIKNFEPVLLPVSGLSLLKINDGEIDFDESIYDHITNLHNSSGIKYCYKIVPLEQYQLFSEEVIEDWIDKSVLPRIKERDKWRITINKRHTNVKDKPLITKIASAIKTGKVSLKEPDIIIQVEIIGKNAGLTLLEPYKILQLKHYLNLETKSN